MINLKKITAIALFTNMFLVGASVVYAMDKDEFNQKDIQKVIHTSYAPQQNPQEPQASQQESDEFYIIYHFSRLDEGECQKESPVYLMQCLEDAKRKFPGKDPEDLCIELEDKLINIFDIAREVRKLRPTLQQSDVFSAEEKVKEEIRKRIQQPTTSSASSQFSGALSMKNNDQEKGEPSS